MRPTRSVRAFNRRRPGWSERWVFRRTADARQQEFGDVTSLVNALRNRRTFQFASLRLLGDLVEVMRGSQPPRKGVPPSPSGLVLETDALLIRRAAAASPCLFRSLTLGDDPALRDLAKQHRIHRLLLCQRDGLGAPVGLLGELLAAAIVRQFGEPAAAAVLDGTTAQATVWRGDGRIATTGRTTSWTAFARAVDRCLGPTPAGQRPPLLHLILAVPGPARRLPAAFKPPGFGIAEDLPPATTAGFDRVVYLTDRTPATAPPEWIALLSRAVRYRNPARADADGPYFSSFVATLVRPPVVRHKFDVEPVDHEFDGQQRAPDRGWRVRRDQCLVPFAALDGLRSHWAGRAGKRAADASPRAVLDDRAAQQLADRWARAVTNRRVGVALSGGGASSFRLVPILEGLEANQVPVDVVSGVSGGALVAAYYCHGGADGLQRCLALGRRMGAPLLARAAAVRGTFASLVDRDLGAVDVTSLPTRLAALATGITDHEAPAPYVVTAGTLGRAVQASGAAPVMFAPVVEHAAGRRMRFADGATAAFVPARILRDCGADLVFALNCLPGPKDGTPLSDFGLLGRLANRAWVINRLLDLWISGSFLAQRIGREADEDAHVYFEPDDVDRPFIESFFFPLGTTIADAARRSEKVQRCIADCAAAWEEFRSWE